MERNNDWISWIIFLLALLLIGLILPKAKSESIKEFREKEAVKALIPPDIANVCKCSCGLFKWQNKKTIFWSIAGRAYYRNGDIKSRHLKAYYQVTPPTVQQVKQDCQDWFMLVRQAYHERTHILRVEEH